MELFPVRPNDWLGLFDKDYSNPFYIVNFIFYFKGGLNSFNKTIGLNLCFSIGLIGGVELNNLSTQ